MLCFTKFAIVYYFLLMLPNPSIVAQQPARGIRGRSVHSQLPPLSHSSRGISRPVGDKLVCNQHFIFCPRCLSPCFMHLRACYNSPRCCLAAGSRTPYQISHLKRQFETICRVYRAREAREAICASKFSLPAFYRISADFECTLV